MSKEFVDCQVNYGKSLFGPVCDLDYFDVQARKMRVTRTLVIPTLTHELKTPDFTEQSCVWSVEQGRVIYRRKLISNDGTEHEELNPTNPYSLMNRATLEKIRELNKMSSVRYYFIPKIHPLLDTQDELEKIVSEPETVGIKLNGLASHISPDQVPSWVVEIVNENEKVIYVHTDYLNQNYNDERIPKYLLEIIARNTPEVWLSWAIQMKPKKLYLAHLARMDLESIRKINESDNIIIGLGPDMMLQDEPMRLKKPSENILNDALKFIDPNKLVYSTDFAWNVYDRRDWKHFDWDTKKRLEREAQKLGIKEEDLESIFGNNAIDFFKL